MSERPQQRRTAFGGGGGGGTDYDKWNRIDYASLGWTAEDERRERMTPSLEQLKQVSDNERLLREAKLSLDKARAEQARLKKLAEQLEQQRGKVDTTQTYVMIVVFAVGAALLFCFVQFARIYLDSR